MKHEDPIPGPVRRQAGEYLGNELLGEWLGPLPGVCVGAGLLIAAALVAWLGVHAAVWLGVGCVLYSLVLWAARSQHRGNLKKGHVAEAQIGRALEQAITADNCAVAHNVMGISKRGDVDHIVVTPQRVWVIETKYRRVPKAKFRKVLKRIHANMAQLGELLPPDTSISGCLVLAYERGGVAPKQDSIFVYNHISFRNKFLKDLRREKGAEPRPDKRASDAVWRLSRGEAVEADDVVAAKENQLEYSRARIESGPNIADERRPRFLNAYRRWPAEDDQELLRLFEAGWTRTRLSERFGRKPSAIKSRLKRLGLD